VASQREPLVIPAQAGICKSIVSTGPAFSFLQLFVTFADKKRKGALIELREFPQIKEGDKT
jgi:hypothetical protein